MTELYVELTEDVQRIGLYGNSWELKERIQTAYPRAKFHDNKGAKAIIRGGRHKDWYTPPPKPYWSVPLELRIAKRLREVFGDDMKLGPAFRAWAKQQVQLERNLRSLHSASDAELVHVPHQIRKVIDGHPCPEFGLPKKHALSRKRDPRPYQRADIKMMSMSNAMNCNEVGTGKTLEAIGAIYEAGLDGQPVLVVSPRRALVSVWQTEFERLSDYAFMTSEDPRERAGCRNYVAMEYTDGKRRGSGIPPLGLGVIAADLRLDRYYDIRKDGPAPTEEDPYHVGRDYKGNWYRYKSIEQSWLYEVKWGAVIVDEFHDTGLCGRRSLFHMSINSLQYERIWPMSATPMGGKARRLWPVLHTVDPKGYSSEWKWIEEWLDVVEEPFFLKGGRGQTRKSKKVGGIRADKSEEFHDYHKKHMTRRLKTDALPGLPLAVELLVPTPMEGKQLKVYREFSKNHEVILEGGKRVSGSIVLAQYTRLRTFANMANGVSCKIEPLLERLNENGIRKEVKGDDGDGTSYEPGTRAYIGCQELEMVAYIVEVLNKAGIDADPFTGKTRDSKPLLDRFEGDDERPYVIVMTTKTGGAGINLSSASSGHLIDEPWDPDIEYQFFGRGDRGARETPLRCYIYRTPNSIQEYVAKVAGDKKITNNTVLRYAKDIEKLRREGDG